YSFGPTFRAEKSKTRRHLTEFWMVEPEVAFLELEGLMELAENFISFIVARVLEKRRRELDVMGRDVAKLENVKAPFPRVTYGEIIGGSQRMASLDLLRQRIREHNLPEEAFKWYLDLRKYGSVPHSGFGMGIERAVAWICGLEHVRETIPFPRTLHRLYP